MKYEFPEAVKVDPKTDPDYFELTFDDEVPAKRETVFSIINSIWTALLVCWTLWLVAWHFMPTPTPPPIELKITITQQP